MTIAPQWTWALKQLPDKAGAWLLEDRAWPNMAGSLSTAARKMLGPTRDPPTHSKTQKTNLAFWRKPIIAKSRKTQKMPIKTAA
mmetsp:Transcript_16650/g.22409  ORF Transcript_16650/g.22409 Transcript_16650/m.22409 type:complete len:84 (+) Transcript_16650:175-426(+)